MKKNNILFHTIIFLFFTVGLSAQSVDLTPSDEAAIIDLNRSSNEDDAIIMFDLNASPSQGTEDWMLGINGGKDQSFRLFKREFMLNTFPNPPRTTDTDIFEATTAGDFNILSDHIRMGSSLSSHTKLSISPNAANDFIMWINDFDGNSKFVIDQQGQIGINTVASYDLHINLTGDGANENGGIAMEQLGSSNTWLTYVTSTENYGFGYNGTNKGFINDTNGNYTATSDRRLKTDIEPLQDILEKVLQLRPSKYYYKESKDRAKAKSYGFIAQEVEEIFPDIVSENEGYKGLAYDNFAILSVAAIQELYKIIEKQKIENQDLKTHQETLEQRVEKLEQLLNSSETKKAKQSELNQAKKERPFLKQNTPNPFHQQSQIAFYLPRNIHSAQLQITTIDGKVLQNKTIKARGDCTETINGNNWGAGTYVYSLIIDGKVFESHQMVLTK